MMKKKFMKLTAIAVAASMVTGMWMTGGGTVLAETAGTENSVAVDSGEETNTERVMASAQNEDGEEVTDKLDSDDSSEFGAGSGTKEDPYEVATAEQLDAVRNNLDAYYIQVADIDLGGYEWEPIGPMKYDDKVEEDPFTGTYDGNGYEIENMSITSFDIDNISIGLFGVNEGTLKNINLVNCNIDINCDVGEALPRVICIGAIAGDSQDGEAIQNCTVTGSISVENIFWGFIGGIVGYGAAEDCTNNAGIDVTGIQYSQLNQSTGAVNCGGISGHAGFINKEISGCVNYADVIASGYSFVYCGGISGEYGAISTCTNYGNITGTVIDSAVGSSFAGNCNVGGIVGATASSLSMCINYGDVSSIKESGGRCYAGGIAGYISISSSYGEISDCYNLGSEIIAQYDPDTQDSDMAGRIAGYLHVYRPENASELYSIDTTLCNGEIPTEDIGTNLKNGESVTKEEIYEMLGIETGDQGTGAETGTAEEYIQQHIEYYNSDQYAADIIDPANSDYLTLVLEEVDSNYAAVAYNVVDELNELYSSIPEAAVQAFVDDVIDMNITTDKDYYLLIANLMLNDEEYSGIQESFLTNYMESCSTVINACISVATGYKDLPGYEDLIAEAEEVKDAAKLMGSDLETFNKLMQTFLSDMDSAVSAAGEFSSFLNDLTSTLSSTCKNFSKIYSYGEKVYDVLDDTINYYCYGLAYAETTNEFKEIISQMTSYAYEKCSGRELEWYRIGTEGYEYYKLYQTLTEFEEDMESYTDDSEEAIFSSFRDDVISLGTEEAIKQVTKMILECIPGLNIIKKVYDAGIHLVDVFTYIDDQAAPAKMMYKSSYITEMLNEICDRHGESLIIADSNPELWEYTYSFAFEDNRLAAALLFDEAVNMYKNSMMFVCDYAAEYSKIALEADQNAISNLDSLADSAVDDGDGSFGIDDFLNSVTSALFMKNASLHSTMIVCASTQKLVTSEIECHDASIQYDFTGDSEIYDTRDMNIFVIACPVSVTVLDEKGEQIAYLSEVKDGYEHYFFTCQGAESSTGLKVAAIPLDEDYTVVIEGTGAGNMYVSSVICSAGVMGDLFISESVPVTEKSTGTLVSEQEGNLVELLFDGKEYELTEYEEVNIENAEIAISGENYYYTGAEIEPEVKVTYNGVELRLGMDYDLSYSDNIEPGTATITVTGTGYFTGSVEINFEIISSTSGGIALPDLENGTIGISDTAAETGDEVTITVTPDDGYVLDNLTVMDSEGNIIEITENGDGEYVFIMPEGDITISVTFTPIKDEDGSSTDVGAGDDTTGGSSGDDGSSSVIPDDTDTGNPADEGTSDDGSGSAAGGESSTSTDDGTTGNSDDTSSDGSSQASGSDDADDQSSDSSSSASSGDSIQTGDDTDITIWVMLAAAAGTAMIIGIRKKRKIY